MTASIVGIFALAMLLGFLCFFSSDNVPGGSDHVLWNKVWKIELLDVVLDWLFYYFNLRAGSFMFADDPHYMFSSLLFTVAVVGTVLFLLEVSNPDYQSRRFFYFHIWWEDVLQGTLYSLATVAQVLDKDGSKSSAIVATSVFLAAAESAVLCYSRLEKIRHHDDEIKQQEAFQRMKKDQEALQEKEREREEQKRAKMGEQLQHDPRGRQPNYPRAAPGDRFNML